MKRLDLIVLVMFLGAPFASAQEVVPEKSEDSVISGTEAVPVEKQAPVYPRTALRKGIEGWVITGFVVNPDGTTSDITIVDSSIEGYFEQAAIEATERFRYEPAMWNGFAVSQARNTNMFTFFIQGPGGGPSMSFAKRYENASEALQDGDLEKAEKIIDQLDKMKSRTFDDAFLLDLIKGNYYRSRQEFPIAFRHYGRALRIADKVATEQMRVDILRLAISLGAYLSEFGYVFEYYEQLLEIEPDLPPEDLATKTVQKVRKVVDSEDPLHVSGTIMQPCTTCETLVPFWSRTLMRDEFTIDQVDGQLDEIKLLCGYQYVTFEYRPDTKWTVNKEWGACDIYTLGTEGTTFRLIEL